MSAQRQYFIFILSQLVSLVGSKISHVALGFWLYEKTHSVTSFSILLFLSFLPNVIGAFVAGPLVDRYSFRWTFGGGDLVSAALMALTALAIYMTDPQSVFSAISIYAMVFLISLISALQWVSLNTYLPKVLAGDSLVRANGFIATATSMASILAPSLASLSLQFVDMDTIFYFDALTFMFSAILVYRFLPLEASSPARPAFNFKQDFIAGLTYLASVQRISAIIGLFALFNFFAGINTNLMTPLYLERYSQVQAGYVLSMMGIGSVGMGLLQTWKPQSIRLLTNLKYAMIFIFMMNIGIAIGSSIWSAAVMTLGLGILISATNARTSLFIQEEVSSEFRGRVFAVARGLSWLFLPLAQVLCGLFTDSAWRSYFSEYSRSQYLGLVFLTANVVAVGALILFGRDKKVSNL